MGKVRRSTRGSNLKGSADTTYDCDLCESSFAKKVDHTKHMMEHAEQKSYACEQCEKCFRSKNALERHLVTHAKSKPKKRVSVVPARINVSQFQRSRADEETITVMDTANVDQELETMPGAPPLNLRTSLPPNQRNGPRIGVARLIGRTQRPRGDEEAVTVMDTANVVQETMPGAPPLNWGTSPKPNQRNADFIQSVVAPNIAKVRKSVGVMCSSMMSVFDQSTDEGGRVDNARRISDKQSPKQSVQNFECDECHALLPTAVAFIDHMKTHRPKEVSASLNSHFARATGNTVKEESLDVENDDEGEFIECNVCRCGFAELTHLMEHVRQQHSVTHPYECPTCYHVFPVVHKLSAHVSREHEDEDMEIAFECNLCNKMFSDKEQLMGHMLEHSAPVNVQKQVSATPPLDARFRCHVCQIAFGLQSQLQRHLEEQHRKRVLKPTPSRSPFSSGSGEDASATRSPQSPAASYACGICQSTFDRKLPMIKHVMTHMDEAYAEESAEETSMSPPEPQQPSLARAIVCQYCEKTFEDESLFRKHLEFHLKKEEEDIKRSSARLQQSEISIIEERYIPQRTKHSFSIPTRGPYACEVCDKKFKTAISLNCHAVMHTGKRPIKNRAPNTKAAVISSYLNRRSKPPEEEEDDDEEEEMESSVVFFICQVCNRNFTDKTQLEKHVLRFHPSKKAFQCDQCNRDFWSKATLTKHEATHAGSSRF